MEIVMIKNVNELPTSWVYAYPLGKSYTQEQAIELYLARYGKLPERGYNKDNFIIYFEVSEKKGN